MILTYFIILILSVLSTLPLGSTRVVYAYKPSRGEYDALCAFNRPARKMIYISFAVLCALLVLCCVFKEETIYDYMMYERNYSMGQTSNHSRELEPTFNWIVAISPTFLWLLAIYAVISCCGNIYALLRNSPNIFLSMTVFICFYFVLHSMVQIRAAAAAAILLIAISYITEREWWINFPLCVVAILFHYSAAIFPLLYFFPHKSLNKWIWASVLGLATVMSLANIQIGVLVRNIPFAFIQNYLEAYLGNREFTARALNPVFFLKVVCAIFMLFNLQKIRRNYPLAPIVLCLFICSLLAYLLFADIPVLQTRIGELLGVSEIFALAMFPMVSRKHYYLLCVIPLFIAFYSITSSFRLLTEIN